MDAVIDIIFDHFQGKNRKIHSMECNRYEFFLKSLVSLVPLGCKKLPIFRQLLTHITLYELQTGQDRTQ